MAKPDRLHGLIIKLHDERRHLQLKRGNITEWDILRLQAIRTVLDIIEMEEALPGLQQHARISKELDALVEKLEKLTEKSINGEKEECPKVLKKL
jgi:cell division protein ZapA (FtsZ GTPase activity inhibitor)